MFLYYYVHLRRPFEDVEQELPYVLAGLSGWAGTAYREGEEIRARLRAGSAGGLVAKTVRVAVGKPSHGQAETSIPIRWEATGTPGLFPTLDGDLVLARVGDRLTQLALRGSYRPPFGTVGRAVDRMVLHRIAEATVKGFVDRIAASIDGERAPVLKAARS